MIFHSPLPPVAIPETPLAAFALSKATSLARKPAIIDGVTGSVITYGELRDRVFWVAAALYERGLRARDVFAILSTNCPEYVVAFYAVSLVGAITTTINPLATAEEVEKQLADSRAKFVLTIPSLLEKLPTAATLREVFVVGSAPNATAFDTLLDGGRAFPEPTVHARDDVVTLPYSSGTTGMPKPVMLTHFNLVANAVQLEATRVATGDDRLLCVLPLFHIYGMAAIMNTGLYLGATIVVLPRFDLEHVLATVAKHRISLAHFVPPILVALTKNPIVARFDLSAMKTIFSGAAPLGAELSRACTERLGCVIKQGYGLTETSPATHISPSDASQIVLGSVGQCVPNTECKILHPETGAELGPGEQGELCMRGPQVMKGYLNRPEITAQTIDREGWLHSGDIGYANPDGHFFIIDRLKELIKYKGFQVAPAELEALLLTHPKIADAAVVPAPDEEAGEIPKAFVVLKGEATADEIMAFVAAHVAHYKRIRKVAFVGQIPKSPSGKILRRVLKGIA